MEIVLPVYQTSRRDESGRCSKQHIRFAFLRVGQQRHWQMQLRQLEWQLGQVATEMAVAGATGGLIRDTLMRYYISFCDQSRVGVFSAFGRSITKGQRVSAWISYK
jgi:hypothetical protein